MRSHNNNQQNDDYGLAEVHSKLLHALDRFDYICRENGLMYSLHGGTLLGAVRNHHIIPWDDDADVSMRRSDYEKLRSVIKSGKYGECCLDEQTTWTDRFEVSVQGSVVSLDVFIWDYISERKIKQYIKINLLRFLQGTMKKEVNYSDYSLKGKILVFVTHSIGKIISFSLKQKIYRYIEKNVLCGRKLYIHRSNDSYRGITYIYHREYMDQYIDIEMEGRSFLINKDHELFLIAEYGTDYLTPPAPDQRRPKHEKQY